MNELLDMFLLMETINSPNLAIDSLFLHDTFFSTHKTTVADKAAFRVSYGTNRLAKFNPELGRAKPVGKKNRGETKVFEFPNIRHIQPFTTADTFLNTNITQTVDPTVADIDKIVEENVAEELQALKNMIFLRIEWMCAQLLTSGAWTYTDEDITVNFDMNVPADFLVTLAAADEWDETTGNIEGSLRLAQRRIQRATGVGVGKVILGENAADAFLSNQKVRDTLHTNNVRAGQINIDVNDNYLGKAFGVDWWIYSREYEDDAGNPQNFFPVDRAVFVANNFKAGTLFGGVKELTPDKQRLTVYPVEIFTKVIAEEDPPSFSNLVHSRPVPYYQQVGSVLSMDVLS